MNNHFRQILIAFSVALNVGFIVAALVIYWNHPSGSHYRYSPNAKKIVNTSNLSLEQKEHLTKCLEQFTRQMSAVGNDLHQSQVDMLKILSAPGSLDHDAFDKAYARQDILWKEKHAMLRDHLLLMRKELGDDKSTWFFSKILTNNK